MPDIHAAKASAIRKFLHHEPVRNVTGVGFGRKYVGGAAAGEHAVRIYVERKLPKDQIPREHLVPESIEGVRTDVIETGEFKAGAALAHGPLVARLRPIQPGCSCGFAAAAPVAGTLGAIVTADGVFSILSNNHVLAGENEQPAGTPILQPAALDGGDPDADPIALLSNFIPLDATAPNEVDCAIAQILPEVDFDAAVLDPVGSLASADPLDAAEAMPVEKMGRTSAHTTGLIYDTSATIKVSYGMGRITLADQILMHGDGAPFSSAGDSGALVVDRDGRRAVGLLCAGSLVYAVASPIAAVLAQLGVTLVV